MTSSNSRGGPPSSRHSDYGKPRRKNYFSNTSLMSASTNRRDFTSNASSMGNDISHGTSSGGSQDVANPSSSQTRNYSGHPGSRVRNSYSSSLNLSGSASYSSQSYFPNTYRNSDASYYGYNQWRKSNVSAGGDSRLTSSNKFRSSLTNSVPQNKTYNSWSSYTNPNKLPVSNNRTGRSYSSKDRRSSSALLNSTKVNDTYYPRSSSLSSSYYPKVVDRYSSNNSVRTGIYPDKNRSSSTDVSYKSTFNDYKKLDLDSADVSFDKDDSRVEGDDETDDMELERDLLHEKQDHQQVKSEDEERNNDDENEHEEDEEEDEEDNEEDNESELENDNEHILEKEEPIASKQPEVIQQPEQTPKLEKPIGNTINFNSSSEVWYPEGCQYPSRKIDTRFEELVKEFQKKTIHDNGNYLKYSLAKPIKDFNEYPFWRENFSRFAFDGKVLKELLTNKQRMLTKKKITLWKQYQDQNKLWQKEKVKMEQQLKLLHPPDDEMRREIESSDMKKQQQFTNFDQSEAPSEDPVFTSRRSRRHGDLVTTEAEFQEILQNLSREQDEDPLVRAERLAAPIPDMILDPTERDNLKFLDSNNIVRDRKHWSERVKTDFFDNFSLQEHELFCEGFCLNPKQFGAISEHMGGLRTASDCVVHYYVTKKAVNYKQLLAQFKKRASKKRGRGKQARSRNVSQSQTPVSTPISENTPSEFFEMELDNLSSFSVPIIESEPQSEQLFTDSGRRKRAAAPEFKGENENGQSKKKQKKKKETVNGAVENSEITESISSEKVLENEEKSGIETDEMNQAIMSDNIDSDSKEKRKTISSYWSITEANLFPELLYKYGTKWTTIADELATKSATMVRNYFQRNSEKNNWNKIAEDADYRLQAKFAAVLKTDESDSTSPPSSGAPANIPIGTFQHAPLPNKLPEISGAPFKVNINSLLTQSPNKAATETDSSSIAPPEIPSSSSSQQTNVVPLEEQAPIQGLPLVQGPEPPVLPKQNVATAPVRSSIMSLLNSELPVKSVPPEGQPAPHVNTLKDLLNSPSVSAPNSSSEQVTKGNLTNILSD